MQKGALKKPYCALGAKRHGVVRSSPASLCPSYLCMISFYHRTSSGERSMHLLDGATAPRSSWLLSSLCFHSKPKPVSKSSRCVPGPAQANHHGATPSFGSIWIQAKTSQKSHGKPHLRSRIWHFHDPHREKGSQCDKRSTHWVQKSPTI